MNIFLSWSGPRSKLMAEALHDWLPRVIQAADPWVSIETDKGAKWSEEMWRRLKESQISIVCLTPENIESRWLHFEAGALALVRKKAFVCTLLLPGFLETDIPQPLAQFQYTLPTKDELRRLLRVVNEKIHRGKQLSAAVLDEAFERTWPKLSRKLNKIALTPVPGAKDSGDLAEQMSAELGKAGLDAQTVAGGLGLVEAPLAVQLNVRSLLGTIKGSFEQLSKTQRAMVYGEGPRILFEMSRALMAEHRWEEAAQYLDEYTEVNSTDWRAQKWRGIAHAMSRKGHAADTAALDAYRQALASLPRKADRKTRALLYNYRGAMFKRLSRFGDAEKDLRKALHWAVEKPLKNDIRYNLACIFALTNRPRAAIIQVQQLRHAPRELELIRRHLTDYFRTLSSNREFLKLIQTNQKLPSHEDSTQRDKQKSASPKRTKRSRKTTSPAKARKPRRRR